MVVKMLICCVLGQMCGRCDIPCHTCAGVEDFWCNDQLILCEVSQLGRGNKLLKVSLILSFQILANSFTCYD